MPLFGKLPGWPDPVPNTSIEAAGADTATSRGTDVVSGASGWGNWTQLLASTAKRVVGIVVSYDIANANTRCEIAIGKGAAASEKTIAEWMIYSCSDQCETSRLTGFIPCAIPAGTRVAARIFGYSVTFRVIAYLIEVDV